MGSVFEIRRFWSAHVDALARHLDRKNESTFNEKEHKEETHGIERAEAGCRRQDHRQAEEVPLNWNKWIRQIHRWLSIVFTVTVIANFISLAQRRRMPPPWVTYSPLFPLALLLVTGLYLFVLPYAAKWRSGRATDRIGR